MTTDKDYKNKYVTHEQLPPLPRRKGNYKVLIPALLIAIAEMLLYFNYKYYAILLHVMIVIGLAVATSSIKDGRIRNSFQALMLLPILRLLNMSMPVFFDMTLYSFVIIYVPMLISLHLIIKHQQITKRQIGLVFERLPLYVFLAIILSLIISHAEYSVITPEYLIPDLSFINILGLLIVMVFFVGFIEEMIFRSVLQTRLEDSLGMTPGLILTSVLFGIMHSGYGNPAEMALTMVIGLLLGFIFQRTRSLPFVVMIHGFSNVLLFGIIPHLGPGFGIINM